jgi:uncharacterized protein (TIGR02996 family)
MTDREALLRAVIENPDDDAPRLVYADWLDEHGDPDRAEFIRVQCVLHGSPRSDDEWKALRARSAALLEANHTRWMTGVPGPPAIHWLGDYYRGFLRHAGAARWADLRADWQALFATTPLVQLTIWSITPRELDDFLARPEAWFLQYVFLTTDYGTDAAAVRIATNPAVTGWSVVSLAPGPDDALTDTGALALAGSPHLGGLSRLHLPTGGLTEGAVQALRARFGDALV